MREELAALEPHAPGSDAVVARLAEWRALARGDDALAAELAGRALVVLAAMGKLRAEEVEALATDFDALAPGAAGRPGLAAAVARAWARDERLAAWLAALPAVDEPAVRERVIWVLDESPSSAYRAWVLRMSEAEASATVLDSVWNEDVVVVNLTRESAPRFAATIESRVQRGDLPPPTRARAFMALGLAAQHAPEEARRTLAYLLTSEEHEGVAAFGRAVLAAIDREESNLQALEGLWDEHERSFAP
jgi:hypothetical protein